MRLTTLFERDKAVVFFEKKNQKTLVFWAVLLLAWPGAMRAETVAPPSISPPDSWVQRNTGALRVLNKLDSTVQTLTLKVGETTTLQTLSITLLACAIRPDDLPADATAHLKVVDARPEQPGFEGWILKREPGINMFEHPVYDIQLAGCS